MGRDSGLRISLHPVNYEQALADLLRVKPRAKKKKPATKARKRSGGQRKNKKKR